MWQFFCPKSQRPFFPSPSVGVAQVWSHCWIYLFDEGDRMGQDDSTHGGSNGTQYK